MTIYLYVKQHSKTGLKYFGKTICNNPYKYLGSGTYWVNHINKHGIEYVETIQLWEFDNQEEATNFALQFSEENNIVESKDWANQIVENALGGFPKGIIPSEETKLKMVESRKAKNSYIPWNKGLTSSTDDRVRNNTKKNNPNRTWSEERRAKIIASKLGKPTWNKGKKRTDISGGNNYCSKPIEVNGIRYSCIKEAAESTGISRYKLIKYHSSK